MSLGESSFLHAMIEHIMLNTSQKALIVPAISLIQGETHVLHLRSWASGQIHLYVL